MQVGQHFKARLGSLGSAFMASVEISSPEYHEEIGKAKEMVMSYTASNGNQMCHGCRHLHAPRPGGFLCHATLLLRRLDIHGRCGSFTYDRIELLKAWPKGACGALGAMRNKGDAWVVAYLARGAANHEGLGRVRRGIGSHVGLGWCGQGLE